MITDYYVIMLGLHLINWTILYLERNVCFVLKSIPFVCGNEKLLYDYHDSLSAAAVMYTVVGIIKEKLKGIFVKIYYYQKI